MTGAGLGFAGSILRFSNCIGMSIAHVANAKLISGVHTSRKGT